MKKAVIIDIDNTLLDFHKGSKIATEQAFFISGIEYRNEYQKTFNRINDILWQEVEKGIITREQLWERRFYLILKDLGLDTSKADKVETDFKKVLFNSAEKVDGAEEILKYLSDKYLVYAGSNAIYNQQVNRLTKAGLIKYFRALFVSEKIGFQKPTREFFDECFKNMGGIKPDETVVIGDSLTADVEGGINYNMMTIWYNHDKKQNNTTIKPDFTVNHLEEIKNLL